MDALQMIILFIIFPIVFIWGVPYYVRGLGKAFASGCIDYINGVMVIDLDKLQLNQKENEND